MLYLPSYYTFLSFISSSLPPHYNLLMSIILISFRFSSSCCDVASKEIVIFAETVNTITSPTVPISLHWRWHFNIFITHRPYMLKVGIKSHPSTSSLPSSSSSLTHSHTHLLSLSLCFLSPSLSSSLSLKLNYTLSIWQCMCMCVRYSVV